jgi:hypothetical protein
MFIMRMGGFDPMEKEQRVERLVGFHLLASVPVHAEIHLPTV